MDNYPLSLHGLRREDLLKGFVEIQLAEPATRSFMRIKGTLERIGVKAKEDNILFQSCHILHKQGRYYIVHFKELFAMDGRPAEMSEEDYCRRNKIALLIQEWELGKIKNKDLINGIPFDVPAKVVIVANAEKNKWKFVPKYSIGWKPTKDE